MNILKKLTLIGFTLCMFSCDNESDDSKSLQITVTNKSTQNIDLLYLATSDKMTKSKDYQVDTIHQIKLLFTFSDKTKGDGTYSLFYKYKNSLDTLEYPLYYYTNGIPLEKNILFSIYNDTIEAIKTNREFGIY